MLHSLAEFVANCNRLNGILRGEKDDFVDKGEVIWILEQIDETTKVDFARYTEGVITLSELNMQIKSRERRKN